MLHPMPTFTALFRRTPPLPSAGTRRRSAGRGFVLASAVAGLMVALVWPLRAPSAPVVGLYEGTVAATDRSERGLALLYPEALKQVAVRVTGRPGAAVDPALAALFADANRYVQTWRPAGPGQVAVGFDAQAVEAALAGAGQPLWPADRPTVWVVLVLERLASSGGFTRTLVTRSMTGEERRGLERMAQWRGLNLAWPTSEGALAVTESAMAGPLESLLAAAREQRAEAVLWVRTSATPGTATQWAFATEGLTQQGRADGGVGLQALADAVAGRDAGAPGAGLTQVNVVVTGLENFPAYTTVINRLEAQPAVRDLVVVEAAGSFLRLRLRLRGDPAALVRVLAQEGSLLVDPTGTGGDGSLRLRLQR